MIPRPSLLFSPVLHDYDEFMVIFHGLETPDLIISSA